MKSFPRSRAYAPDQWIDQLLSHSDHAALTPEVRQNLFNEICTTIDGFGGTFVLRA